MQLPKIWLWQRAPALRLLVPFAAGVVWQWYAPLPLLFIGCAAAGCLLLLISFSFFPVWLRFKAAALQGVVVMVLLAAMAMGRVHEQNVRNDNKWFGNSLNTTQGLLVTLQEPLVEKPNSYKAVASVEKVARHDSVFAATGNVILYFKKEAAAGLTYGPQLWVFEKVEPVRNSGNPGGFDYERYTLFQGITHQAYLTTADFVLVPAKRTVWYKTLVFNIRQRIVTLLRRHIQGTRETGLAEALLIGYKDDLDKTLVQAYSNTGVVHIIAISGLHVGLIYSLLLLLTKPLRRKKLQGLRLIVVLTALWGFGLVAGAQPSVMRSVLMFSVIATGTLLRRNASVYNNLALSALVLLCINPFWLWDVGFQLSYTAVLSIIVFFKPVYNFVYVHNKALDAVWKLVAVTLAAQVLTTPISLYYFHQFPLLFLFTNIIAVPLSTLILIGELLLCGFFFVPPVAHLFGWLTTYAIRFLNHYIERLDVLSFSVWPHLFISAAQAVLLLILITGIAFWLLEKKRSALWAGLAALLLFITLRTWSFLQAAQQQKLIVYNIAKRQAVEIYNGREATFVGDETVWQDNTTTKLHLQPSRIMHRIRSVSVLQTKAFTIGNKTVLILDTTRNISTFSNPHIDVLILSKNPKLYLRNVAAVLNVSQVVIDASVPRWKAQLWLHDCDSLHISCHDVARKGAFVMPVPHPTFAAP